MDRLIAEHLFSAGHHHLFEQQSCLKFADLVGLEIKQTVIKTLAHTRSVSIDHILCKTYYMCMIAAIPDEHAMVPGFSNFPGKIK